MFSMFLCFVHIKKYLETTEKLLEKFTLEKLLRYRTE